jgi:hypothetical protein
VEFQLRFSRPLRTSGEQRLRLLQQLEEDDSRHDSNLKLSSDSDSANDKYLNRRKDSSDDTSSSEISANRSSVSATWRPFNSRQAINVMTSTLTVISMARQAAVTNVQDLEGCRSVAVVGVVESGEVDYI